MSSQEQDKEPEVVASLRLRVEDRDKLRAQAKSQHRTLSSELRRIVEAKLVAGDEEAA